MRPLSEDTIKGAIYGLAFGDAWGYITEFHKYSELKISQPPIPNPLMISDDTQMSLYTIDAITDLVMDNVDIDSNQLLNNVKLQNVIRTAFADEFVHFFHDKDNNRAPGMTCMTALSEYIQATSGKDKDTITGLEGGKNNSKGCGANMRSPWLGLLPYSRETIALLAVLQTQPTHGHTTGQIAAAMTSLIVHGLAHGIIELKDTLTYSFEVLDELRNIPSNLFLNQELGFTEVEAGLKKIERTLSMYKAQHEEKDINAFAGEGWIAEEALFNAILAVTVFPDDYLNAMKVLVYSNGDSDSIAAIGGSFWGASQGYEKMNTVVAENLEPRYQEETFAAVYFLNTLQSGSN